MLFQPYKAKHNRAMQKNALHWTAYAALRLPVLAALCILSNEMYWKIFTSANTAEKAKKVLRNVTSIVDMNCNTEKVEPYHKGGFVCTFSCVNEGSNWPESVFLALTEAQKVGRGWILSGSIEQELDAWCNESSVSGVENMHLVLVNNA